MLQSSSWLDILKQSEGSYKAVISQGLLFLFYINDLPKGISSTDRLYAAIYRPIVTAEDVSLLPPARYRDVVKVG